MIQPISAIKMLAVSLGLVVMASPAADLAPTGTLRATFLGNNPVQGSVDAKTGAITGPVADIVKELARRAGVPYQIKPAADAREVIEAVNSGAADIGFLAFEAERARQVDFTGPYLLMGTTYLLPATSSIRTAAEADRKGVKIAAVDNQAPSIYLKDHLKNATLVSWSSAPSYEELIRKFAAGEIDAFSGNRSRLIEAAAAYPTLRVAEGDFAKLEQNLVVRKGDVQKLKIINAFLDEVQQSTFLKDSFARAKLAGVEPPSSNKR
jgi:polar amino acid transport system substrate-binding protein